EVHRHDRGRFVVIEEDVVSIGSESTILVQESPYLVQSRLEFLRNAIHCYALAHRCKNPGPGCFDGYDVVHKTMLTAEEKHFQFPPPLSFVRESCQHAGQWVVGQFEIEEAN